MAHRTQAFECDADSGHRGDAPLSGAHDQNGVTSKTLTTPLPFLAEEFVIPLAAVGAS